MAINLADIPRCVACVLFWVHLILEDIIKILEDIIEDSTSVLATALTSQISVRATAVNLADKPSCVACVLF